jgi:hypothetical protein
MAKLVVEVWQKKKMAFDEDDLGEFPQDFVLVAKVQTDDLDVAFEKTNTINKYWWENEGVEALVTKTRSTSVGDVMVDPEGKRHLVASAGFKALA